MAILLKMIMMVNIMLCMYIFNTIKKPQPFKVFQRDGTLEVVVPFLKLSNTDFIKKHKIITLKFIID